MAEIRQDLLSLNYSPSFDISGMQEAEVNLSLPPAVVQGSITGAVTDGVQPLAAATVKLFDSTGTPYMHTLTDASGAFSFSNVPAGTYSLAAVLPGYVLSPSVGVTLTEGGSAEVSLVCTAEAGLSLGTIAGVVSSTGLMGTVPVSGAKIDLANLTGTVIASTYSAADGEFVFYDVADGVYSLTSTAAGYSASAPTAVTILGGSIANASLSMAVDGLTNTGTVSGIIRDSAGTAVANCFVGLYAVTDVGGVQTETLIATTRTNSEGKYLFGGVTAGSYIIKAKLEQLA